MRQHLDREWQKYLTAERQKACPHLRVIAGYEVEAHMFCGQNVISVPARCKDCGKELEDAA